MSAPGPTPLASLRDRFGRLQERGAKAFDGPSMVFLGSVLGRAGALADTGRAAPSTPA